MSRIAYTNGRYVRQADAMINIEDRGYQFADGVYEVIAVVNGQLVDGEQHFDRLQRSLEGLQIDPPCSRQVLVLIMMQVLRRNRINQGIVYLQITTSSSPGSAKISMSFGKSSSSTGTRARIRRLL